MTSTNALTRHDDGYQRAKTVAQDAVCRAGHELQVVWATDHYEAACVTPDCRERGIIPRHELEAETVRARLERDPQLAQSLAVAGTSVPMTTAAIKGMTEEQMRARVDQAFVGVRDATPELRAQLVGTARMYGLDPLFDIQLYQGTLHIKYEGRMRKLREAPTFRGEVELRPLTKAEKEEWDFPVADIVIKCSVDMGPQGIVTDFGVVRAVGETSPVAKSHPQLIAIKRARARVSRVATGIDLPVVIDLPGRVIDIQPVEKDLPAVTPADVEGAARRRFWAIARGTPPDGLGLDEARVHELLRVETVSGYPGGWDAALRDLTERAAEAAAPSRPEVTVRSAIGQRLAELVEQAAQLGLDFDDLKPTFPLPYEEAVRKGEKLRDRIDDEQRRLEALERTVDDESD